MGIAHGSFHWVEVFRKYNYVGGHMHKFGKAVLPILAAATLFVIGSPSSLWAQATPPRGPVPLSSVPEIDPSFAMAAMTLLAGAVVVIRGWRKR